MSSDAELNERLPEHVGYVRWYSIYQDAVLRRYMTREEFDERREVGMMGAASLYTINDEWIPTPHDPNHHI